MMPDVVEVLAFILAVLILLGFAAALFIGLVAAGWLLLVALSWAIYHFLVAHPIIKAAVVASAVGAAVLIHRRKKKKEEKKPLFDIRLVGERCVPLEEGVKTLPPNVASAIEEVVGPSQVYRLCVQTYEGGDVPGGRAEVMALKMLFAPDMIVVRLLRVLDELGLQPSAESRELGWIVYFQKPKTPEDSAVRQASAL